MKTPQIRVTRAQTAGGVLPVTSRAPFIAPIPDANGISDTALLAKTAPGVKSVPMHVLVPLFQTADSRAATLTMEHIIVQHASPDISDEIVRNALPTAPNV